MYSIKKMKLSYLAQENMEEFWMTLAETATMNIISSPTVVRVYSTITDALFNSVLRFTLLNEDAIDNEITAVKADYESRGLSYCWWSDNNSLTQKLKEHNLTEYGKVCAVHCDLETVTFEQTIPEGYSIKEVIDSEDFKDWQKPIATCFHMSQEGGDSYTAMFAELKASEEHRDMFRHYVAYNNDRNKPVSSCTFFFGTNMVGIYNGATLEEHQRKGLWSAIVKNGLYSCKEAGHKHATAQANPISFKTFQDNGFKTITQYKVLLGNT